MRTLRFSILIIALAGAGPVYAQAPLLPVASVVSAAAAPEADTSVSLLVGRSTLVDTSTPIARVSLTSADVADAMVTAPTQLLVHGKEPGTITMYVWDRAGGVRRYEVIVQRDLARLTDQVRELFPGESVTVQSNGKNVVLSGTVSNKDVIERMSSVAAGYVEKKEDVVSLLQIRDGGASNQVLLRVRFAEVNRSAMTELGASFFTSINGYKDYVGRATTQQFAAPDFDPKNGGLVFSDYLDLFLFNTKEGLGAVIKALSSKGLFQSLAEPNLVAESGKEASFLAGGEIPIPVAQGTGGSISVTVEYKEFGIRLNFLPVVTGNRVHLRVRPEVSMLDFNNAVVLNGFRIPALSTRRTETELELENGQTFAIAGLMNNTVASTVRKIPGIGDIPILGLLFQSKAAQKDQTELVVMITPEILPNNSVGVTNRLPYTAERFMEPLPSNKLYEQPAPAFGPDGASRSGDSGTPKPASEMSEKLMKSSSAQPATVQQAPAPVMAQAAPAPAAKDPQAAASTVAALTPMTRPVINGDAPAKPAASAAPAASATAAPGAVPASTVSRPLTRDEQKVLERARKQEEQLRIANAKVAAQQVVADREKQKRDAELADKQAKEQAKADAAAAKVAAEEATRNAELEKKRAKAESEAEARRQKVVKEAEAKLKEAQASYELEVAKVKK